MKSRKIKSLLATTTILAGISMNTALSATENVAETDIQKLNQEANLASLRLTPEEVAKRNKELQGVYDYLQNATIGKIADLLETMGMNVYRDHYKKINIITNDGFAVGAEKSENASCSFSDKASTMGCYVSYALNWNLKGTFLENSQLSIRGVISGEDSSAPNNDMRQVLAGDANPFGELYYRWFDGPFLLETSNQSATRTGHHAFTYFADTVASSSSSAVDPIFCKFASLELRVQEKDRASEFPRKVICPSFFPLRRLFETAISPPLTISCLNIEDTSSIFFSKINKYSLS